MFVVKCWQVFLVVFEKIYDINKYNIFNHYLKTKILNKTLGLQAEHMLQNMNFMEIHMLFASRLLTVHKKEHPRLFTSLISMWMKQHHFMFCLGFHPNSFSYLHQTISIAQLLVSTFVLILLETQNSCVLIKFWEFSWKCLASSSIFSLFSFF